MTDKMILTFYRGQTCGTNEAPFVMTPFLMTDGDGKLESIYKVPEFDFNFEVDFL
jgi:hypothetical protein